MTGSMMSAAISSPCEENRLSIASASLKGTMIVSCHIAAGTPSEVGRVV